MAVAHVLAGNRAGAFLEPNAGLLIFVADVPTRVDVMRGRPIAVARFDLEAVALVVAQGAAADPEVRDVVASLDPVLVAVDGAVPRATFGHDGVPHRDVLDRFLI